MFDSNRNWCYFYKVISDITHQYFGIFIDIVSYVQNTQVNINNVSIAKYSVKLKVNFIVGCDTYMKENAIHIM